MDGRTIYMRLAEAWCAAEREATNATLKACYADRAARYFALALGLGKEPQHDTLLNRRRNCQ
jgi:hypothetical protein